MAEAAADCAGLDLVLVVPAGVPPHRGPAVASAEHRLQMCRLAVEGHRRLQVSDLEVCRPGPSYTVDTLRMLAEARPSDELYLVLGWDAAREVGSWYRPAEVLQLARLLVVTRPGHPRPGPAELAAAGIDPGRAGVCDARTPDVVATEIRRLAAQGGSLTELVAPAVERYIREQGLYAGSSGAATCGSGELEA